MGPSKHELRRALRQARDSIPPELAAAAAEAAAEHLLALPAIARAATVALYAPVRGELDPTPAARRLRARGAAVAYPRVLAGARRLTFHLAGEQELEPGAFGILEPPAQSPAVAVETIDAFVLPGLAFDRAGSRLGWGHGYYDRTLAGPGDHVRIGYCFERQIVARVPRGPTDLPVHHIVTESGTLTPEAWPAG
ncbi:MAG TPA: 5-formyltetrahydrofolate cyclo-ligase [Kofleriaceae bacterium]|nr:5-formyltetrahydrofolate cyclo-ligase [Kofleriaceae bacterium]